MEIQWALIFYTLLIGASVGVFALTALLELRGGGEKFRLPGALFSLVLLALGGFMSVLHLEHPERSAYLLGNFKSAITQEMYLVFITGALIVLYIVLLRNGAGSPVKKIVAALGLISGIALAAVSGLIYVLPARPAWNSWLLPLLFLTTGLSLGVFFFYVWILSKKSEDQALTKNIMKTLLGLLVGQAVLLVAYLIFLAMSSFPDPSRSPARLLGGDLALFFWLGVVLIGLVLPLFLVIQSLRSKSPAFSPFIVGILGSAALLVGGVSFRVMLYLIGSTAEKF